MKKVLGLDASSTTIGICLLSYDDDNITLDHLSYYKPPKKGNLFERLSKVREFINESIDELEPDCVAIEDIVLFMSRQSTAKTVTTLAVLNRTVGLAVFDKTAQPPYLYNAMRIRHAIKQDGYLPAKEDIPELVAEILDVEFPYVETKKGTLAAENGDMADAIACGLCHIYMDREGRADALQLPKKKKKRKRKNK
jgi:Holliday junction resolvasome RuvABC endonuclease subunit